ncbi:MAG: PEGA domain-containing protein [Candidatus Edwardsbacteria bacterium]|nr:PEGA domain-containing protein [Candidatus Edwardsbacteria bacterium]
MERMLKEQAFQLSGACSEASCIKQIGQMLAVKKMVGGSISKIDQIYTVEARLIDVENGTIDTTVTEDFGGDMVRLLTSIMPKIARRLIGAEEAQKQVFGGNASLYIKSDPPGGTIYIDDQPMDQVTPVTLKGLIPGAHTIRVETAVHEKDTMVTLAVGGLSSLNLSLSKKMRKIRVSTDPQEAEVYIDAAYPDHVPHLVLDTGGMAKNT